MPFVTIGSYPDKDVYQIDEDHQRGSCDLVAELISKGLRRIALFGGNLSYIVTETRKQGFIDAHSKANIEHQSELYFANLLTSKEIEKAAEGAVALKADCIVCMDDNICEITLRKLAELRISVPQEMKIASLFGSVYLDGRSPSITCLEFNTKKLGMMAGMKILDIVNDRETSQRTVLSYKVNLKESTG
jgi:DNA-binding LacI/PurR family transcriptional regulator